jgi:hypothetical protein
MKEDSWGQVVFQGKQFVIGKYYKQQGKNPLSYILYENGFAMIYFHLIFVAKFTMEVTSHRQKGGKHGKL